jgi:hypothetical protein
MVGRNLESIFGILMQQSYAKESFQCSHGIVHLPLSRPTVITPSKAQAYNMRVL